MEYKDYYQILGIDRSAGADEIKQAYRRMARKYHPDVSDHPQAESRFKDVNEAHEVLGTPEKRQKYDQINPYAKQDAKPAATNSAGGTPQRERFDAAYFEELSKQGMPEESGFSDFFDSLFGKKSRAKASRTEKAHTVSTAAPADTVIGLEVEEVFSDTIKSVQLADGKQIQVRIPKGATEGKRIRLPGKGPAGKDLTLVLHIKPHPLYRLENQDIHLDLPITPWEAALGANIPLRTPSGAVVNLKIPANSQSGRKMRLPERGLPGPGHSGDMYLTLQIHTPPATTQAQHDFYHDMSLTFSWTPRSHLT